MALDMQQPGDEPRIIEDSHDDLVEQLKWPVLGGIVVLLGGLAAYGFWWNQKNQSEVEASRLLMADGGRETLEQIVAGHSNTPAGAVAIIRLAREMANEGEWAPALEQYDLFLRLHRRHSLAPACQLARANVIEAMGDSAAALDAYHAILTGPDAHPFSAPARLGIARIHISEGNHTAARQSLTEFLALEENRAFQGDAERMLRSLPPES